MPVKFNIKEAIKVWKQDGGKSDFEDSLRNVLKFMQNDPNVSNIKEASYLLATAKAESDYSLTRWEADYVCGDIGVPYKDVPCQKALNYYRSSDGKSNYYTKGVDSKGIPYFGRGLIQLTNKYNYKKYGDLIGVDLVKDGDKALDPKNSYKIASIYLKRRTWEHIASGDLTKARKSVNGGTKGVDRTNKEYFRWIKVFENPKVNFKATKLKRRTRRFIGYGTLGIIVIGGIVLTSILVSRE